MRFSLPSGIHRITARRAGRQTSPKTSNATKGLRKAAMDQDMKKAYHV